MKKILLLLFTVIIIMSPPVVNAGGVVDVAANFLSDVANAVVNVAVSIANVAVGVITSPSCLFGDNVVCDYSNQFLSDADCRIYNLFENNPQCGDGATLVFSTGSLSGDACAYSSRITFYDNDNLRSADEENSKVKIYRFIEDASLSGQPLTDWLMNLRSKVGSGITYFSDKESENYDLLNDYYGTACYGRDRYGTKNYCHSSVLDTTPLLEVDYKDFCKNGVCSFIDTTLPSDVVASYIAKTNAKYEIEAGVDTTYTVPNWYQYSSGRYSSIAAIPYNNGTIPVHAEGSRNNYKYYINVDNQKVYVSAQGTVVVHEPINSLDITYKTDRALDQYSYRQGLPYNGGIISILRERTSGWGSSYKYYINVDGQKIYSTNGSFVIHEPVSSLDITYKTARALDQSYRQGLPYNSGVISIFREGTGGWRSSYKYYINVNGQKIYSTNGLFTIHEPVKDLVLENKFLSTQSGIQANFPILYTDQQYFDKGSAVFGPITTGADIVCIPSNVLVVRIANTYEDGSFINHGFKITWEAPASTSEDSPVWYKIYRGGSADNLDTEIITDGMRAGERFFMENRIQDVNSTLYYKVVAVNEKGEGDGEVASTEGLSVRFLVENMTLTGAGFSEGMSVFLVKNGLTVGCSGFELANDGHNLINGTCDITDAPTGEWTVRIISIDGQVAELPTPFTITLPEPEITGAFIANNDLSDGILNIDWIKGDDLYSGASVKIVVNGDLFPCTSLSSFNYEEQRFEEISCDISNLIKELGRSILDKINIEITNDVDSLPNIIPETDIPDFQCVSDISKKEPLLSSICFGVSVQQIDNCGDKTYETGQMTCGENELCENNQCVADTTKCTEDWVTDNLCNNLECGQIKDICDNTWACPNNCDQDSEICVGNICIMR
jgi:hypothetical protein